MNGAVIRDETKSICISDRLVLRIQTEQMSITSFAILYLPLFVGESSNSDIFIAGLSDFVIVAYTKTIAFIALSEDYTNQNFDNVKSLKFEETHTQGNSTIVFTMN